MSRSSVAECFGREEKRSVFDYASVDEAFPSVDPGLKPFGSMVLVQLRQPKTTTAGGLALPPEVTETDKWNSQVAKVISLGPACFCNRDTLEPWPEGAWCIPGQYVRVPKYGGDRWEVPYVREEIQNYEEEVESEDSRGRPTVTRVKKSKKVKITDKAIFILFRDLDLSGQITCDPLSVIAFI